MLRYFPLLASLLALTACNNTPPASDGTDDGGGSPTPSTTRRIQPSDLQYLGAFRLPERADGAPDAESWEYGGLALAYRPDGDPAGAADGFPGSLFGTGHQHTNYVSEISIPAPSLSRNVAELNTASTLQGFHDVRAGLFAPLAELPRVGLEYLAAEGDQPARLYLSYGQHFQEDEASVPSHAWLNPDLSAPNTQGAWWVGSESLYSTNGYMFVIPTAWATQYTGGRRLATGRYRDGGWSGMGPSLFAIAPWQQGNPPAAGTHLQSTALLRYSNTRGEDTTTARLNGYLHSDEWEGGAWLTTSDGRTAVLFAGTKGSGYLWYGFFSPAHDGMPCVEQDLTMVGCYTPEGAECPAAMQAECPGHVAASRGWWSSRWDAQFIFYDPADFAAVAAGTMSSSAPQPYAMLDVDEHLFLDSSTDPDNNGTGDQRRFRLGEVAYDRDRNLLYVVEQFAEGSKPLVHVWRVN